MKETINSINIELIVQAVQMDSDNIWMQGDLKILINGEKPYAENDMIDVDIFLESMNSDGEFFIFSCICGIPECSGWDKGIFVLHNENNITWKNGNTNDVWRLDKTRMEDDLAHVKYLGIKVYLY